MSFDTPNGTHGSRKAGTVLKLVNKMVIGRIRRKGGQVMGVNALVLTTVGRKSGIERETPVGWFDGGNGSWLIVASANGQASNPTWYLNIGAHPDKVQVQMAGNKVAVIASQLAGEERKAAWEPDCGISTTICRISSKNGSSAPNNPSDAGCKINCPKIPFGPQ